MTNHLCIQPYSDGPTQAGETWTSMLLLGQQKHQAFKTSIVLLMVWTNHAGFLSSWQYQFEPIWADINVNYSYKPLLTSDGNQSFWFTKVRPVPWRRAARPPKDVVCFRTAFRIVPLDAEGASGVWVVALCWSSVVNHPCWWCRSSSRGLDRWQITDSRCFLEKWMIVDWWPTIHQQLTQMDIDEFFRWVSTSDQQKWLTMMDAEPSTRRWWLIMTIFLLPCLDHKYLAMKGVDSDKWLTTNGAGCQALMIWLF